MKKTQAMSSMLFAIVVFLSGFSRICAAGEVKSWRQNFDTSSCVWSSKGQNDFFILQPGYQEVLEGREEGSFVHLEITVMTETRMIGNVETRLVEERETHNGKLEEISRNYFAVCGPSNDVYYFGEEVDIYENGKLSGHEGAWLADSRGAKAGLFMGAKPQLGDRFYQEVAPEVAMDRVEVISNTESLKTPAGEFHDCVKTEETTPIEPNAKEYKVYAAGIGVIQDGELLLVKHGTVALKNQ